MAAETYQCPGESYTISRSVHLGRLASFYPKCRDCPHRGDTGGLGPRIVRALANRPGARPIRYDDGGVYGVYLNEIDRTVARQVAGAFGLLLRQTGGTGVPLVLSRDLEDTGKMPVPATGDPPVQPTAGDGLPSAKGDGAVAPRDRSNRARKVVVSRDEHPSAADLATGAIEGLRFAGCEVVDLGVASVPCHVFALGHLGADGGLMAGGDGAEASGVSLRLWRGGGRTLETETDLRAIQELIASGIQRPTRAAPAYNSFQGSVPYLACLLKHFHALRPLKVAAASPSAVMEHYVSTVFGNLACSRVGSAAREAFASSAQDAAVEARMSVLVTESRAHVGVYLEPGGERARFFDEQGRPVETDAILPLLLRQTLREHPGAAVVLEEAESPRLAAEVERMGGRVVRVSANGASMTAAMLSSGAPLGGEASGRIWFQSDAVTADALLSLAGVMAALSWTDAPMSQVLAAEG